MVRNLFVLFPLLHTVTSSPLTFSTTTIDDPAIHTPPPWNVRSTATGTPAKPEGAWSTGAVATHPTHVERGISGDLKGQQPEHQRSVQVGFKLRPGAQTYNGRGTFFAPGLGACGSKAGRGDAIVALNSGQYGDMAKTSQHCFRKIRVMNTENGKSQVAVIQDACPSCGWGGLDL
ncbi:hypothetical protein FRB90_003600, partial [Tulasnella sp. 427]